ncbi:MAG: PIN domain-containing protein [Pirellulaceae bacterium]
MIYVDTNILIDALRGYAPAIQFLEHSAKVDSLSCSQVCEVELLAGAPSRALRRPVEKMLKDLTVITPTQDDFAESVQLFRAVSLSHGVEFLDCLVAATALRLKVPLHTRNVKHFSSISSLLTIQPYK